jgi:2-isopropylmalate synthase
MSRLVSHVTGIQVQRNKAIVGQNAFAHEAGIHQDGVLKNPLTYEIMTPQSVGVPDSRLVLGKHSGRHALAIRCEQLGYQFDRRALDDIYIRFVRLADKIKHVEDHHLLELIRDTHKPAASATPLFEPLPTAIAAAAAASAASQEAPKPFPMAQTPNGMPLPVPSEHHEQEDYLWGV